jgi:DUF4097 and DUF4098 domain-containing protein YvlB
VNLKRVGGNIQGRTTNGGLNIELAGDRWTGNGMDVTTTNGGITLKVPQNFSAQLDAETSNGGIHSDLPLQIAPASGRVERRVSASIGAGGAMLKLRTTNGGVTIKRI